MKQVKLTTRLDEKTHKALKVKVAQKSTTTQAVVEDAIKVYVGHKIKITKKL